MKKKTAAEKAYTFSFGNSTKGPIGAVVCIKATSRAAALELAQRTLGNAANAGDGTLSVRLDVDDTEAGAEYMNVYFNPDKLSLRHIECVEDLAEAPGRTRS